MYLSLRVFWNELVLPFFHCLSQCLFVGQSVSLHQMFQRISLWLCFSVTYRLQSIELILWGQRTISSFLIPHIFITRTSCTIGVLLWHKDWQILGMWDSSNFVHNMFLYRTRMFSPKMWTMMTPSILDPTQLTLFFLTTLRRSFTSLVDLEEMSA